MLTDYERYQLEWMIEHRHSLDELMVELTYYQNDLEATKGVNLTVSDVFDAWTSDRGFASLENDVITKDMIRAGIEHGVIRFEVNPDPNDPWKTVCAIGNGWFYHVDTTDIPPDEYIRMNSRNVDMVVDEIYDELNSTVKSDYHDDFKRYLAVLNEEHHGGTNSLTGIPFDINETMENGGAYYNPERGIVIASFLLEQTSPRIEAYYGYTYDEVYDSWLNESPLPSPAISQQPEKIAVAAGYRFNLVDTRETSGIDLKGCGTVVTVDGHDYEIMKGATYEDSRKVDDLLDSHGDKPISDYRKRPQGMSLKQAVREAREASAKLAEENGGTDDHDGKDER